MAIKALKEKAHAALDANKDGHVNKADIRRFFSDLADAWPLAAKLAAGSGWSGFVAVLLYLLFSR